MTSHLVVTSPDTPDAYWSLSRHPVACLAFLAPLLAMYEAGVVWFGGLHPQAVRNGADYWMRTCLERFGFEASWLLPLLVVVILLTWQVAGRYPWRISSETLAGMFAESLLFAFLLIVVGQLVDLLFGQFGSHPDPGRPLALLLGGKSFARDAVAFLGAGVYEEVLFRMCLLPVAYAVLRLLAVDSRWAAGLAVVSTSVLFAAVHYLGPAADGFTLFSFTFRTLAGMFFAGMFLLRGIGITVGAHAAYDLLVGLVLLPER